jgi:plastocyanin
MGFAVQQGVGRLHLYLRLCALFCITIGVASDCFSQQITVMGRIELFRDGTDQRQDSSDAVVWLTPLEASEEPQVVAGSQRQQLAQKNKSFLPHVLVVRVGVPVAFPNKDPFFHNVFSLFEGKRFDLGLYEAGTSRTIVFDREGISYIFCNIHPDMSGVVLAVKTPYYGTSDRRGVIAIPNVPPGRYELRVWRERVLPESLDTLTRTILISEASHSFGVLRLTEQRNTPQAHKNKYGQDYDNATPAVPVYPHP